jgi:SAM-dependent methyltransferase
MFAFVPVVGSGGGTLSTLFGSNECHEIFKPRANSKIPLRKVCMVSSSSSPSTSSSTSSASSKDPSSPAFQRITSNVEKLYDTYPFPPDPLIDEAPIGYNWRWHYPSAFSFVTHRMPESQTIRILDAGCGTGCGTEYLVHLNPEAQVVGVDLSSAALDVAKERITRSCGPEALKRLKLIHGSLFDIDELLKDEDGFDMINCVGVIHHTPDPQKALNLLASKLKPGGILHIFVYALYGRWEIMLMQKALRLLQNGQTDYKRGVELGRRLFKTLPENNRLRVREETRWAQENQRDSTFADVS